MSNQPIIGITMGDAAGVGPEIIVKALDHAALYEKCRPIVIGDPKRLQKAIDITHSPLSIRAIDTVKDAHHDVGTIDCIDLGLIPEKLPFGQPSPVAGDAAYQFIARAVELASTSEIQAICTAPINKAALRAAGHHFSGHTELLRHLSDADEVFVMMVAHNLRVIHVTADMGLIDAINKINEGLVERTIRCGYETLVKAGIPDPRIGVCGINPHAGENGLFGNREEEKKIMHALAMVQLDGIDATGPLPADTLFYRAIRGDFDLVVAMYHDQGHGPVKVLGLEAGVNITVGLDVIRTSVDHGTAFDIAGTGKADEGSMVEALYQASALASNKLANYEKPPRNVIEFPRQYIRTTPRGR